MSPRLLIKTVQKFRWQSVIYDFEEAWGCKLSILK